MSDWLFGSVSLANTPAAETASGVLKAVEYESLFAVGVEFVLALLLGVVKFKLVGVAVNRYSEFPFD